MRSRRWTTSFLALVGIGFVLTVLTLVVYFLPTPVEARSVLIVASASLILIGLGGFYFTKAVEAQKAQLTVMEPKHLIGMKGVAKSHLRPGEVGIVWVSGNYWTAEASEEIPEGQEIQVKSVDGLRLRVESSASVPV